MTLFLSIALGVAAIAIGLALAASILMGALSKRDMNAALARSIDAGGGGMLTAVLPQLLPLVPAAGAAALRFLQRRGAATESPESDPDPIPDRPDLTGRMGGWSPERN